jgi:hypothetical protein
MMQIRSLIFRVGLLALLAAPAVVQTAIAQSRVESRPDYGEGARDLYDTAELPESPEPQQPVGTKEKNPSTTERQANKEVPATKQQPKRILGIMPNYRAVSAGAIPPPPTAKQAFKIATQNSFDYSSYVFVGLTSMIAEGEDAHPALGKGVPGFWGYTWRGFVDKTDGNYWVIFALPTVFHQDERYYAKGEGPILKRALYSSTRVLITPSYSGRNTFNISELMGRGIAQGISISYYPKSDISGGEIAEKWAYALLRDAATNTFREFWPDIATHVLHQHPASN